MDDEIFVVGPIQSEVTVYNSHSLTASRDISVTGMKSPASLATCIYNKALYVSDAYLLCIHRVDLNNNLVTRWKIGENQTPYGLSVTKEHTLLVTVHIEYTVAGGGVVEYTSEGQLLRDIRFDGSIMKARHTVQLSSDQFIVCHGNTTSLTGICIISPEGQIIKSYDREKEGGQLKRPGSIAIDIKSKRLFVGDLDNHKIIMLDCDFTYLGEVRTTYLHIYPFNLHFHSSTDRLFVADLTGILIVISHPRLRNQRNNSRDVSESAGVESSDSIYRNCSNLVGLSQIGSRLFA